MFSILGPEWALIGFGTIVLFAFMTAGSAPERAESCQVATVVSALILIREPKAVDPDTRRCGIDDEFLNEQLDIVTQVSGFS